MAVRRSRANDGGISKTVGPAESRRCDEMRGMSSKGIIAEMLHQSGFSVNEQ
jgi:hypothetical protein